MYDTLFLLSSLFPQPFLFLSFFFIFLYYFFFFFRNRNLPYRLYLYRVHYAIRADIRVSVFVSFDVEIKWYNRSCKNKKKHFFFRKQEVDYFNCFFFWTKIKIQFEVNLKLKLNSVQRNKEVGSHWKKCFLLFSFRVFFAWFISLSENTNRNSHACTDNYCIQAIHFAIGKPNPNQT